MSDDELRDRIGEFDGIVIRSATKLTADLIERGARLKVIGRAGTGVDNVDVEAATKRGIVVVNAPESNSVAAAEHTLALALALCRNVPQAHASLLGGEWARSRFAGNELYGKTLGVIGFGRIGQLVAKRAQSFEMQVIAYDKFVAAERFRELGVERAETTDDLYAEADLITIHLPKTPETVNWIDADAIAQMKDGVRIVNCARGELVDLDALAEALDSGKVGGAALDVFPRSRSPITRCSSATTSSSPRTWGPRPPRPRTAPGRSPPSRCGARSRAGWSPTRSTSPPCGPRRWRRWRRSCRCARSSAGWRRASATARSTDRGRVPRPHRRARHPAARDRRAGRDPLRPHRGAGQPGQRPGAGRGARDRADRAQGRGVGGVHRAGHRAARVRRRVGRGRGHRGRPAQPPAPGQGLGRELLHAVRRPHRGLPLQGPAGDDRAGRNDLRPARRQHRLGGGRRRGIGRAGGDGADHRRPGPPGVLEEILELDGFDDGRAVDL